MLKVSKLNKFFILCSLTLFFLLLGAYCSLGKVQLATSITIVGALGIIYLFLFKREVLFQINLFLLPLSMEVEMGVLGNINYPSEIITLIIFIFSFPFFLNNIKEYKNFIKHPIIILLFISVLWMFITSLSSDLPMVGIKRSVIRFLYLYMYLILTWKYIRNNIYKGLRYLLIYGAGLIIPAVISIVFMANFNFIPSASYMAGFPYFKDHTIYGAAVAFVLAFIVIIAFNNSNDAINRYLRPILFLSAMFFLLALVLSFSRAAWISILAAFTFVLSVKLKVKLHKLYLLAGVILVLAAFNWGTIYDYMKRNDSESSSKDITEHAQSVTNLNKDASNMERINRWVCALRMFKVKPVLGYGPGTYQFFYGEFQTKEYKTRISTYSGNKGHAHSEYLGTLCEQGLLGFLLLILTVHLILKRGSVLYQKVLTSNKDKNLVLAVLAALFTFFVHSLFNGFMDTDKIAGLVFISIVILVGYDLQNKEAKTKNNHYTSKIITC